MDPGWRQLQLEELVALQSILGPDDFRCVQPRPPKPRTLSLPISTPYPPMHAFSLSHALCGLGFRVTFVHVSCMHAVHCTQRFGQGLHVHAYAVHCTQGFGSKAACAYAGMHMPSISHCALG